MQSSADGLPVFGESARPAFQEFDPADVCACEGCRSIGNTSAAAPVRFSAADCARRALITVTAAGTLLSAGSSVGAAVAHPQVRPVVDDPHDHPQGTAAPLHGAPGAPAPAAALKPTTRADIIRRAKTWVSAKVPYSLERYWRDGYRQDCSGFVSMAWNLGSNQWTGTLDRFAVRVTRDQLQPGDILLFHNPADPERGSHVTIFGGWTDYTRSHYLAYEQARPHTRKQATPYAYWSHSKRYTAYRYKALTAAASGAPARYPGRASFGPGVRSPYVTQLGKLLVERGGRRFYRQGPGPVWGEADRRATQAFQLAQGWRGKDADGLPGPLTWEYLVSGKGRDIPAAGAAGPVQGVPAYPGRAFFRPGQSNAYITQLGRQLVKKGYGRFYAQGPGPRWGEADRRAVEAFQRAQGWRGGAADGMPGPETWRRLFR
ncbi:peptidoglycan-binding protein [Streptomyces indicus]|uniref:Peptidoglycan-binding (PGRP) domain of peptidoglycan hydrolases-containing protein n=1 Tax=Streptomyces indicus TaxID=417292 RepID=A0A1G9DSD0_9ACTN|nr:peptidoglycan-binding protein [Streptomyces indicus]SDK66807.1 Peptidoglycan-binding (PGRP) domain of peptidoglycan hydrolases-containing protein [Streptomyces indicus]